MHDLSGKTSVLFGPLDELALGVAMRLLEDLVGERVRSATRVEIVPAARGGFAVSYPPLPRHFASRTISLRPEVSMAISSARTRIAVSTSGKYW